MAKISGARIGRGTFNGGGAGTATGSGRQPGGCRDAGMAKTIGRKTRNARRGVLFALSAMLLGIILISFSFYLSQQSAKAKQAVAHILEIDGTSTAYSGMEAGLRDILSNAANFSVENNSLMISESLPISPQVAIDLGRFSQFESENSGLNATMNLTNMENASFLIQPGSTRIEHSQQDFYIIPQDSPEGAQGIGSYGINITFPEGRVDSVSWQPQNASGNGTNITIHIRVQNEDYSFAYDLRSSVDMHSGGTLEITEGGREMGRVVFASPASVQVHYTGNIGLKAWIEFSHPIYVEANDTITIVSAVNRTGRVRIA